MNLEKASMTGPLMSARLSGLFLNTYLATEKGRRKRGVGVCIYMVLY